MDFLLFFRGVFVCPELVAGTEHTQLCGSRESKGRRVRQAAVSTGGL